MTWTRAIDQDAAALLNLHGCHDTTDHCRRVATLAVRLAADFALDSQSAYQAGWLHDISVIIPANQRLSKALKWGLTPLPEEEQVPLLLHQRLSAVIAEQLFAVRDQGILAAIGCHTTLRSQATALDKVVFIADKLAWDQDFHAPFAKDVTMALQSSLDDGVVSYMRWLWGDPGRLLVIHPWLAAAYAELTGTWASR